jgi:hypothetical protein
MIQRKRFSHSAGTLLILISVFSFTFSVSRDAEARHRRHHHSRHAKRAVINEPKLYERLGGAKAVSEIVDAWIRAGLADARLNGAFGEVTAKPDLVVKLRKNLNDQICELSDGPCTAKADSKKSLDVYALSDDRFVIFASHLVTTLDNRLVAEREKNELLGRIGGARNDSQPESKAESKADSKADSKAESDNEKE